MDQLTHGVDADVPSDAAAGGDLPAEPRDAPEPVECPECGGPSTTAALGRWGNCRACRTAQSRLTNPLRW